MKTWDGGVKVYGKQIIPTEDIAFWNLQESEDGTIYYTAQDSNKQYVWCAACNLKKHLRKLESLR